MDLILILFGLSLTVLIALVLFSLVVAISLGCSDREELFGFEKIVRSDAKVIMVPYWIRCSCLILWILTFATGIALNL